MSRSVAGLVYEELPARINVGAARVDRERIFRRDSLRLKEQVIRFTFRILYGRERQPYKSIVGNALRGNRNAGNILEVLWPGTQMNFHEPARNSFARSRNLNFHALRLGARAVNVWPNRPPAESGPAGPPNIRLAGTAVSTVVADCGFDIQYAGSSTQLMRRD